jgi:hypothetical protein
VDKSTQGMWTAEIEQSPLFAAVVHTVHCVHIGKSNHITFGRWILGLWQELTAAKVESEISENPVGPSVEICSVAMSESRGENIISGKAKINDAIQQISKLWDEVEHSGASVAWEWILRGSLHGARIRQAEARVDAIGSKGDQAALQSACDSWVTAWRDGIKAWRKRRLD